MARGAERSGWVSREIPLSDGGEGLLDVLGSLGGELEVLEVESPLGPPVRAEWRRVGRLAIIEMARASGLELVGGASGNDPMAASSRGTGQLMVAAARSLGGAGTMVVGLGGSATTDGGLGALELIEGAGGLGDIELIGACDVRVRFNEAVTHFARQKGATDRQVVELAVRFEQVAARYRNSSGIDVALVEGAGAAGGFGGAIAVLGGSLRSGYEVVTGLLGFDQVLAGSSLVVTGEGALDSMSFAGKVAGSVIVQASTLGIPSLVLAGQVAPGAGERAESYGAQVVSLSERFGDARSRLDTARCIERALAEHLGSAGHG